MIRLFFQSQTCRGRPKRRRTACAGLGVALGAALLLLTLSDCSQGSMPVLRSSARANPPPIAASTDGGDPTAAQCEQLRAELRSNQEAVREAPTTSTSPQIVAAAQAKADKRIDDTRARLDDLDCASDSGRAGVKAPPQAPLPPAPGAANP
jgi:hypothetical protein